MNRRRQRRHRRAERRRCARVGARLEDVEYLEKHLVDLEFADAAFLKDAFPNAMVLSKPLTQDEIRMLAEMMDSIVAKLPPDLAMLPRSMIIPALPSPPVFMSPRIEREVDAALTRLLLGPDRTYRNEVLGSYLPFPEPEPIRRRPHCACPRCGFHPCRCIGDLP
jgi:hypothetical protein